MNMIILAIACFACLSIGSIGGALLERSRACKMYLKADDWALLFWIPIVLFSLCFEAYIRWEQRRTGMTPPKA